jgi:secondary thiamine-phosphate synthase enzyme
MFEELTINTSKKEEIVDITKYVKALAQKSKIKEGICLVFVKHTTCSIFINENDDPAVHTDILNFLRKTVPDAEKYAHHCDRDNAASHIRAVLIGPSKTIAIKDGNLQLGTWQGIYLAEFDGSRERHIAVEIIGS